MPSAIEQTESISSLAPSKEQTLLPVVYFGNDWSAENRTSSHHIARCLARRFPLLYVETPGLRRPQTTTRDLRKLWRKICLAFQRPRRIGEQMWLVTLPQIPFRRLPGVGKLNSWAAECLVRRAMRRLGFPRPVLWFVVPHMGSLLGRLGQRFSVYYCTDAYAALPNVDSKQIARMDEELTRRADQVFVTSRALLRSKQKLNPTAEYSPHGVDASLFERASDPSLPIAEEAKKLHHPVIGFFGLIEAWIDLDLMLHLAKARPNWTFLMIGRVAVELGELERMPNVIFSGPQPYESLPHWAKAFDVAILPYRQNKQVLHANPLKLKEYLATGKPVVSMWTPEVEPFAHCIGTANTSTEFLLEIETALSTDSLEKQRIRRRAVSNLTWDARVENILAVLYPRLTEAAAWPADSVVVR